MSKNFNKEGKIEKGWGYEVVWASNEHYCGKFLVFTKKDAKFSIGSNFLKTQGRRKRVSADRVYFQNRIWHKRPRGERIESLKTCPRVRSFLLDAFVSAVVRFPKRRV